MIHLAISIFFLAILGGAGLALQRTLLGNWPAIAAGLRFERSSDTRVTVTLRPQALAALARPRQGVAA